MSLRAFYLLGLAAAALGQDTKESAFDFHGARQRIFDEMNSTDFVPYTKPSQKIEEFIALGDSYTAGTGCNGVDEIIAGGDAARGKRSYPMQMSTDEDNWGFINNDDEKLPRFSFHAHTGDTTTELVTEQLKSGDYKDDKNLPRAQPFGKPQVAVVTIGGNDAGLSDILNNCIYRAWLPKDCQETLKDLQSKIDDGSLREKVNFALYQVVHRGRESGGANPRESFQVFVPGYVTFFNEENPECDDISWSYFRWGDPKLTRKLRKQLNDLTRNVNKVIKDAANDLERMGVIFVDGLEKAYEGHRYCEPGHTSQEMVDYETWFWTMYSKIQSPSEGPGDPNNAYSASDVNPGQQLLDFVFPGKKYTTDKVSKKSPPWEWEGAKEKYPTFNDLLVAIRKSAGSGSDDDDDEAHTMAPFQLLRSFHPKGTAYGEHKDLIFGAMADNRGLATNDKGDANYTERCKDWDIKDKTTLVGTCKDKDGKEKTTQHRLNLCLKYDNGALIPKNKGNLGDDCKYCFFNTPGSPGYSKIWCVCKNENDPFAKSASVQLDDVMKVQDDGFVECFGHISAPAEKSNKRKRRIGK